MQEIEGKEYLYSAGSCCLINRNILHTEHFLGYGIILFIELSQEYVKELIHDAKSSCIHYPRPFTQNALLTFMEENMRDHSQKEYLDFFPVYQNLYTKIDYNSVRLFETKNAHKLYRIVNHLVQTLVLPQLGADFMIKALLFTLFEYLESEDAYHMTPIKLNTKNDALLFSRIRRLMEDTNGRISRTQLEGILHYSGNYLYTIVKQFTGMSLFDYGMTFCMKEAARLLSETDKSVSEIMEILHFSNWGHFNHLFRKQYGVNPKKYRQISSKT